MNKHKIARAMPTVLFISGIVGVFVSEVMAARDTLKAEKILYEKNFKLPDEPTQYADNRTSVTIVPDKKTLVVKEIEATWKCYIPTAISTTLTVAALTSSHVLTTRQIALLSSAVAGAGGLITKYRDEIKERLGVESLRDIDKKIAAEEIKNAKPPVISTSDLLSSEEMDLSNDEEILAFDPFTGQKFRTTKLALVGARYYLNRNFALGGNVPLSMFYAFLGLELPEEYNYCEWDCQTMCDDGYYWIDIDFTKSDEADPETGENYYIIEYGFDPGETEDSYYIYGNPMYKEGSFAK